MKSEHVWEGYWWRQWRERQEPEARAASDAAWAALYGEDALQRALSCTEWTLQLACPPGDDALAQEAASGEARLWEAAAPPPPPATAEAKIRRRVRFAADPAMPKGPPAEPSTALAGMRQFTLASLAAASASSAAATSAPPPPPRPTGPAPMPSPPAATSQGIPPMPTRPVPGAPPP